MSELSLFASKGNLKPDKKYFEYVAFFSRMNLSKQPSASVMQNIYGCFVSSSSNAIIFFARELQLLKCPES